MLIEATLLILVIGHLLLIYACHDLRKDRTEIKTDWGGKWSAITELLEELLDAIDSIGGGSALTSPIGTGGGIQDFLTQLVMSKMTEGLTGQYGTEETNSSAEESSESETQ